MIERQQGANAWLDVTLTEGKNREIRRLMEALGLTVNRLIRVNYGPFALGALPPGAVEEVVPKVLRQTLGAGVAAKLPSAAEEGRERRRREQSGAPAPKPKAGDAPKAPARRKPPRPHHFDPDAGRKPSKGRKP